MLEKSMYDSWVSRIHLFIKGKKHGRMILDSIDNGPLVCLTVEEDGHTRPKKYSKLAKAQQLQDDCDVQATNIILHGLSPDMYALVNHQEAAKDIWDKGETLYEYYWRFSQLINDIHTIGMTMQQVQVNTKFLNALPPEWSNTSHAKKISGSSSIGSQLSDFIQSLSVSTTFSSYNASTPSIIYTSLSCIDSSSTTSYSSPPQQQSVSPQQFLSPSMTQQPQAEFPQMDSGLAVPTFQQGDDPNECINKEMTFLSAVASMFPSSNNQLRMSSNPRN
ncbi:hypothetical protein Tco_0694305 [Tanacetum coccineum]